MVQLDPGLIQNLVAIPVVFGSVTVVTVSIIRFKLKKKELEMRARDSELGPVVDALRDDLDDAAVGPSCWKITDNPSTPASGIPTFRQPRHGRFLRGQFASCG